MAADLAYTSLTELGRLLDARKVSPVEIVSAALDRIERYNGRLASYITVCGEAALAAARRAEQEITGGGGRRTRLHGLPIAHKDISLTKGVRTTAHSRCLIEHVPDRDATHVRRLAEAGVIMLGKTNTTEFACGTMDVFGVARNPWDLSRYTGGSSAGSASALAAGMAPAATGSDTGGSIRVPASFCGIVGLKPTYGRVSRYGLIPLSWSMDHVGPMARTVADCALLLSTMAGHDPLDPTSARTPVPDFTDRLGAGVRGMVLGVPKQHFYEGLEPEVDAAARAALRHLEGEGARLEPVDLPLAGHIAGPGGILIMAEAYGLHARQLRERAADYGDRTRRRIASGACYTSGEYEAATRVRVAWTRQAARALERVDAIVTPTLPHAAFTVEVQKAGEPPDTSWGTRHFNLSGHPALTLPCGFTAAGLPIGMQLAGRYFDEATLFRIAHAYERSTPWHDRRPALAEAVS
jgi:aspartyl-tRNA(Asn)/glutamyl-tRNA(Gln) amidotransferase subunit A